jgi:hypothetical protein
VVLGPAEGIAPECGVAAVATVYAPVPASDATIASTATAGGLPGQPVDHQH